MKTRSTIGMQLTLDSESYEQVGKVMDAIEGAVRNALYGERIERAAFDFVSFNTHPCKAVRMDGYAQLTDEGQPDMPMTLGDGELPLLADRETPA